MVTLLLIFLTSVFAGFVGAMMGVGGGIILVPVLVSQLDVPLRLAVGASMVAVVATSNAASANYIMGGFTNLRLGILLAMVTIVGAIIGVLIGKIAGDRLVTGIFSIVLLFSAWGMYRKTKDQVISPGSGGKLETTLMLSGQFTNPNNGLIVRYGVKNIVVGMALMLIAGIASGLLGIGGGIIQVPIMDTIMSIPIKGAVGTSNFMMGLTSAAGSLAFFVMGEIHPLVAGPVTIGVFFGSLLGSKVMPYVKDSKIRHIFVFMLVILALEMAIKTFR